MTTAASARPAPAPVSPPARRTASAAPGTSSSPAGQARRARRANASCTNRRAREGRMRAACPGLLPTARRHRAPAQRRGPPHPGPRSHGSVARPVSRACRKRIPRARRPVTASGRCPRRHPATRRAGPPGHDAILAAAAPLTWMTRWTRTALGRFRKNCRTVCARRLKRASHSRPPMNARGGTSAGARSPRGLWRHRASLPAAPGAGASAIRDQ
jgi:hypothetical protein